MGQCCRGERCNCGDWSSAGSSDKWKIICDAGGGWHRLALLDKEKERGTSLQRQQPSDGTVFEG